MKKTKMDMDEQHRRSLQEYIFNLEDFKEKAEELTSAHEQLKQSQDLLMAVMGSTTHGICLLKKHTFFWCNKAFTDILGWTLEEVIGKTAQILHPGIEENEVVGHIIHEYDLIHKDGHRVPCLVAGRPLDMNNPSGGYVVSIIDFTELKRMQADLRKAYGELEKRSDELVLTNEQLEKEIKERKAAEDKLNQYRNRLEELIKERTKQLKKANEHLRQEIVERKQAEELYKTLAFSSHAGVYIAQEGNLQFVNPRILEYTGYSEDKLLGHYTLDFIHPDDRAMVRKNVADMMKGTKTAPYEYRIIDREGNIKWLMETVKPIIYKGDRALLGNTMDITERYQMEKFLNQSQKMQAIGTLAGGIAHDFNNILGAMIGYTEMAQFETSPDKRQYYLDQVIRACDRAKNLVNQILTFSRQREQERKPILLAPIIKEGIKLLRSSLPSTIKITQSISDSQLMVLADPTQIHQVLMNLCTNAAHAMQEGGGILNIQLIQKWIYPVQTTRPIGLEPGDYAELVVNDTGYGIDSSIIDRIFDPFFTTKKPGEGTGLGLSVVYGIVRNHGGAIDVASTPGQGTTFNIYLPLIKTDTEIEEKVAETVHGGSERILFVDDEAALVEGGKELLASLGYRVTPRMSSVEALDVFRERPHDFDLVITDMTMPNMTGVDLARELLKIRPNIPIIICTGYSHVMSEEMAKSIGIRRLAMKPLFRKDLAKAIREVLETG
jgi:PAS domain S-box-containing protein